MRTLETSHKQICRKCLQTKLNVFRPIWTVVDINSNTFYKCTATFRTHRTSSGVPSKEYRQAALRGVI
jgi:hypothetical protein